MHAEILYCVTLMHILVQKKVNVSPKNYVKMKIFGLWNNFHHRIHCKYFGKTVSCSNDTKLFYVKATKGCVLPSYHMQGIGKKETLAFTQKNLQKHVVNLF